MKITVDLIVQPSGGGPEPENLSEDEVFRAVQDILFTHPPELTDGTPLAVIAARQVY